MFEYKNIPITDWAIDDRPREKLIKNGISALSNTELIAILLATGTKNMSAVDLAKHILQTVDNNLHLLGKAAIDDLIKINGIGQAKAITIQAALELGRRRRESDIEYIKITSSQHVADIFIPILGDLSHEELWAIYLSRSNNILSKIKLSMGGTTGTVMDVKIVIRHAVNLLANGIILVHNHPSGNISVSREDKAITEKVKNAAALFDISLIDHVVIADKNFTSFADNGLLIR